MLAKIKQSAITQMPTMIQLPSMMQLPSTIQPNYM